MILIIKLGVFLRKWIGCYFFWGLGRVGGGSRGNVEL